jgi:hypothetical protein
MKLRCKVFRADESSELEDAVNRFLTEELSQAGPVQFEEITQSEGPHGVTVLVWYSLAESEELGLERAGDDGDLVRIDDIDGKEFT